MVFSYRNDFDLHYIKLSGVNVECVKSMRYLGVIFDNNLNFKLHTEMIASKLSKNIGILSKVGHLFPRRVLLSIYYSIVHPYLNYCIAAYYNAPNYVTEKLFILQKRAIRLIVGASYLDHTDDIFRELKVCKLQNLFLCNVACHLYKCIMYENFDDDLLLYISRHTNQHSYATRNTAQITLPIFKKSRSQSSIYFTGCKTWNHLEASLKESLSFGSFKLKLKRSLILSWCE